MNESDFPLPPATFEFLVFSLKMQAELRMGILTLPGETEGFHRYERRAAHHRYAVNARRKDARKFVDGRAAAGREFADRAALPFRAGERKRGPKATSRDEPKIVDQPANDAGDPHYCPAGPGTSAGVPTILCECAVCHSSDPHDRRSRPSILIRFEDAGVERAILIDTTPDFREQALAAKIQRIDTDPLHTHPHADHILGLDDVRPFNYRQKQAIPLYGSAATLEAIGRVFCYAFEEAPMGTAIPRLNMNPIGNDSFELFGMKITPIPVLHGKAQILGYRFGNCAYLTDHSSIPESSMELLRGLDVLFLDALRHRPHPTHSTVWSKVWRRWRN